MNKTLHKTIFNKKRGCLVVVAENTHSDGKGGGTGKAAVSLGRTLAATRLGMAARSFSVLSFSLALALGTAVISSSPAAAEGIAVDPSAARSQQPTLLQTGNGIPLVNIQTPTAAGVSVNQYTRFDIGERGAILNNSHRNAPTQLGGWIQGNPWLAGAEARIIVNQVNSSHPSLLNGYIEVGGRRAEVVVANPAGIRVDGAGFINASRALLTTGQPHYQSGALAGFAVRQGEVSVAGRGLDTQGSDYTHILAGAAHINAPVWGRDVRTIAGQNDVSADGGSATAAGSPSPSGASPTYAIDTGVLGGMYAGKITLVTTHPDAVIRNRGQVFATAGAVAVDAAGKLVNSGTIAAPQLDIRSPEVDNRQGKLLASRDAAVQLSGRLHNQGGEITAANQLTIHDGGRNTLAIENAGGIIQSGHDAQIQAKSLGDSGTLKAGHQLAIALQDDFDAQRTIEAGHQLTLTTQGKLRNRSRLQAGHQVVVRAGHLSNEAQGIIESGGNLHLSAEHDMDNRGVVNSHGLTRIDTGGTLTNIGSGKIYGDHIALGSSVLNNREENIGGQTQAGSIVARERLDIGAGEINNREGALISSAGTFFVGGHLDASHHAAGMAQKLTNSSARIEAAGGGGMAVRTLRNLNAHFKTEEYLAQQSPQVREYTILGQNTYYQSGKDGWFDNSQGQKNQRIARFHLKQGGTIDANQWHVRDYHIETYQERITENRPGEIVIGGNLEVAGQDWLNKDSHILVGGILVNSSSLNHGEITNESTVGKRRVETVGSQWDSVTRRRWYQRKRRNRREERNHNPYRNTEESQHDFGPNISLVSQHHSTANRAGNVPNVAHTGNVPIRLPDSSLYHISPNRPGWLVETDPRFSDYRRWLGSDYMLRQLQTDPTRLHKRLGDGYYEQKLINEQIHQLTGYRRLDGYTDDEAQYKALMDNGLAAAKTLALVPGIRLSAEQIQRLENDIVWPEAHTVTLADGTEQTVLVPKVYTVVRPGSLQPSGSLISAQQIQLALQNGTLRNSGTIAGRESVSVHARDIHHSGQLQGRRIGLAADNELVFQGGQAQAETAFNAQARNIRIGSTTQTSGDGRNGNTVLDREAGISVTGKGGTLGLYAQNDLHLDAATLSNAAADGTTRLVAGNQLQMGTVRTEHHEAYGSLADKNHRHIHQSQEIGSVIDTAGNVQLAAGGDIRIRQGDIHSSNGQIALRAGRDITLSEGRQTTELDAAVYLKSRGILSSTKNTDQYRFQHDEAVGSRLSGANVTMQAAGDIHLRGSHTTSQNGIVLNAGGDIRLEAAQNHYTDHEYHEERKSGLMGSGGLGFTIGQRKTTDNDDGTSLIHSGSSVTSENGNIRMTAGGHYRQSGSRIVAGGDADVHARSIDVSAVNDRYSNQHIHTYQQKGLTVSLDIGPLQAAQNLYQSARTIGQSRHGRTNAMAAANTGWQAYQLIDGYKGGRLLDTSNLSLSVGYGQQKNRSEVRSDLSRVQESSINAGGKTRLHATGAGQASNITVTGSDIQGAGGTLLAADNRILLQSATFGQNEESRHQSSGWNVGATARYDGKPNIGITVGGQTGHGNGHGAGESHRHSHIGNKDSQTILQSGGDTTLRGAQVAGKGIQADVQNLSIESVQDTAAYQGRQKSGGAQISAGYGGVGINGHYSQSQLDADHRSVTEQSGLYAGDDGYQIHVRAHTELNGGLITSSQSAEDNGKNHFSTGTLGFGDLHNHSHYQGESLGMDAGVSRSNKTQGQKSDAQPDDKNRLSNTAGKNGTSHGVGYGSDSDRQESVTRSGINTRNLQITDEASQIRQTGLTAEETRAKVYTGTTTESAQADAGSLHNRFDKEQVQKELDVQREVTRQFAPVAAQQIANVSDSLGNTRNYQIVAGLKADWEQQLTQAQTPEQRAELQQNIAAASQYLSEHQVAYDLWKEGGIGRSLLHAGSGALLTGGVDGALASGSTALAAPHLNEISGKLGGGKVLFDALSGAAIGLATGGNAGAMAAGANTDWNNRQLHPDERKWIVNHAKDFARRLNGGREPTQAEIAQAERRLAQQAAKNTDLLWMITLEKVTDISAKNYLRRTKETFINENNHRQQLFTTQGKQFVRPELFSNGVTNFSFYKNNLHSPNNRSIIGGVKELVRKFASSTWERAKEDPSLTVLKTAAAPVHLLGETIKSGWNCASNLGQCLQKGKEHFVETGSAIGTGFSSIIHDNLQPIYGQNIHGAQTGLVVLQTVEGVSTAFGAAKALNVIGKGSLYFINESFSGPPSGSLAAQIGSIGGQSNFIKSIVASQKIAPDLLVKGVHFNIGRVELKALPDNHGGIVFKPVFSSYDPKDVTNAIAQANRALKDESFRNFLIKHAEAGINLSEQNNNPKILEFRFLRNAVQRLNNATPNFKRR